MKHLFFKLFDTGTFYEDTDEPLWWENSPIFYYGMIIWILAITVLIIAVFH
jgi:hypothetical protein